MPILGIDLTKLAESDAALTMQYHYPENYPQTCWAMNHYRFGAATMFSLFLTIQLVVYVNIKMMAQILQ